MTYVATRTITRRQPNGKVVPILVKGAEISNAKARTLSPQHFATLRKVERKGTRLTWNAEQAAFAVDTYLDIVAPDGVIDRDELSARFHAKYPERGYQGVSHALHQIRTRDIFVYQGGFTTICAAILKAMYDADVEGKRFFLTEAEIATIEAEREAIFAA